VFGNQSVFRLVFGVTLALFAANGLFRPRIRRQLNMAFGVLAGVIGGFLSGAFTAAGPALALFVYSRQQDPRLAKDMFLKIVFSFVLLAGLLNILKGLQ
jgi:uncharacterized membrane protein YfcA